MLWRNWEKEKNVFLVVEKFDIKNNLTKNFYFILSTLFSSGLYAFISTNIYGKIMLNPQEVYSSNIKLNDVIGQNNYFEVVADCLSVDWAFPLLS